MSKRVRAQRKAKTMRVQRKANVLSLYMPHHVLNVTNEMWGSERVNPSLRREQGIVAS